MKKQNPAACRTCMKHLKSGQPMFCSDGCRSTYWAARRILAEYRAGKANGLTGFIDALIVIRIDDFLGEREGNLGHDNN
jgi:hypothetical protein